MLLQIFSAIKPRTDILYRHNILLVKKNTYDKSLNHNDTPIGDIYTFKERNAEIRVKKFDTFENYFFRSLLDLKLSFDQQSANKEVKTDNKLTTKPELLKVSNFKYLLEFEYYGDSVGLNLLIKHLKSLNFELDGVIVCKSTNMLKTLILDQNLNKFDHGMTDESWVIPSFNLFKSQEILSIESVTSEVLEKLGLSDTYYKYFDNGFYLQRLEEFKIKNLSLIVAKIKAQLLISSSYKKEVDISKNDFYSYLTPIEKSIVNKEVVDETDIYNIADRFETILPLLYYLGITDTINLPFYTQKIELNLEALTLVNLNVLQKLDIAREICLYSKLAKMEKTYLIDKNINPTLVKQRLVGLLWIVSFFGLSWDELYSNYDLIVKELL